MKAPRIVLVHQIKVQFCWKGVTGMIAARRGGSEAMRPKMATGPSSGKRRRTFPPLRRYPASLIRA
jgi:hypothetical protein